MSDTEMVQEFMRNIVRQIAMLDLEQMRQVQNDARRSREYWDSFGGMVDPTTYRNMLSNGTWDRSRMQTEVVDHLIAIRKLITDMDAIARRNIPASAESEATDDNR